MATIYEAIDRETTRTVAVKVVPRDTAAPAQLRRDFDIGSRLSNPGILRYLDFIETEDYLGIVSEPMGELRPLGELHDPNGNEPLPEARKAFKSLHDALCYLHESGFAHGNLTPETVMVDLSGTAKLTEFGHCVSLGVAEGDSPSRFHGTPLYSSPEHQTGEQGAASDYFVFGALVFEHLAGKPLFETNATIPDLLEQIKNSDPGNALARFDQFSERQCSILESLLSRTPSERHSGWEMASRMWSDA